MSLPELPLLSRFPFPHSPPTIQDDVGPAGLHVVIPWASCLAEACTQALHELDDGQRMPNLHVLLSKLTQTTWLRSDEYALSTPHEMLWADAQGWPSQAQGVLPIGAWLAHEAGVDTSLTADQAWGLITPCHWAMGHDSLTVLPPDALQLQEDESRALWDAARTLFESEGWALHWVSALQWLVSHPSLADLPTASFERVVGRNPDVWLASHPQARLVRRLQAEVQMLWYQHPVNEQREQRGLPALNSFWLSGCGVMPLPATKRPPSEAAWRLERGPQQALMHMDIPAWLAAWQTLDAHVLSPCTAALAKQYPVKLSLCGERHAVTLTASEAHRGWRNWLSQLRRPGAPAVSELLRSL